MRQIGLCFLCLSLVLVDNPAHGQASFALQNQFGGVDAPVYDAEGDPLEGTGYLVELWGGAVSDSLSPARVIDEGNRREIIAFNIGGYFFSPEGRLSVTSVPPRGYAWLEVRAWEATLGNTYEEVEALGIGGYGESPLFYAQGNDPTLVNPELPALLIGLQSFSLRPIVPEPSGSALFMLGGMTWWWVRYRRGKS